MPSFARLCSNVAVPTACGPWGRVLTVVIAARWTPNVSQAWRVDCSAVRDWRAGGGRWIGLLRVALRHFIRAGTLRVTTAGGTCFHLRRRHRPPVAIRFTTRAAECGVLLDPELKFGEAYMNGTLVVEQGSIADVLSVVFAQRRDGRPPLLGAPPVADALSLPPAAAVQSADSARAATSRTTTTSTASSMRCSSTPTGNTAAPISRRPTNRSTTPRSPRSGTWRPSSWSSAATACSTSAAAGAGSPCISPKCAGPRHRRSRSRRNSSPLRAAARRERLQTQHIEFRLQDYRDVPQRFDRIVSVGMFEHVGVGFYDTFFRKCADAARRRRRDGAAFDRPLGRTRTSPIPGSQNTSSPAAISLPCRRFCRRSNAPGCWSPTSRSCACTMPRR